MGEVIAIHKRQGFSERWHRRCEDLGIEARVIEGYRTSITGELRGCDALLWHLSQDSVRELKFGRSILCAADAMGLHVFPNHGTVSHFDDKVAQKYLLEAIDAPLAPTWVFFTGAEALEWVEDTSFPKVFKLRRGAGSTNVRLVSSREEAIRLIHRMFGKGISPVAGAASQLRKGFGKRSEAIRILPLLWKLPAYARAHLKSSEAFGREQGYVYFQEFIPGNQYDIRVTVIGDRAFFFRRRVRPGDFRASGSGLIEYSTPDGPDMEAIRIGFSIAKRLNFQSMAFDFVVDQDTKIIHLLEISYVFNANAVHDCPGYFDSVLKWHLGHVWPQDAILDDVLSRLRRSR